MQWVAWLIFELICNLIARKRPVDVALGLGALAGMVVLGMLIQAVIPHH